jgi:hypothetical protein
VGEVCGSHHHFFCILTLHSLCQVFVINDLLCYAWSEGIVGWTISNLPSTVGHCVTDRQKTKIPPTFRVLYDNLQGFPLSATRVHIPSQWYRSTLLAEPSEFFFDVVQTSFEGNRPNLTYIRRGRLSIDTPQTAPPGTQAFFSQTVLDKDPQVTVMLRYMSSSMSSGYLSTVLCARSPARLYKIVYGPTTVGASADNSEDWKIVPLQRTAHPVDNVSIVCPSTGRMAYICGTHCGSDLHDDNLNRIHLIDYLFGDSSRTGL